MAKMQGFPTILKRILKYLGIALAVIFLLISIVSWIVIEKKNDWLLGEIQYYMNESQSGHLKIASTNFKIFRNFPDVTIELDSIQYYEHHDTLRTSDEKPILYAEKLFVAIELLPLIKDELKISDISLSNAKLNIIQYKNGKLNVELALAKPIKSKPTVVGEKVAPKPSSPSKSSQSTEPKKQPKPKQPTPAKKGIQIDLQSVSFNEVDLTWNYYKNRKPSTISLEELEIDLSRNENVVDVTFSVTANVQTLYLQRTKIPSGKLIAEIELQFDEKAQALTIKQSEINYDEFSATIEGTYAHQKNHLLNIEIDASSNDLEMLSIFIKPEVLKQNPDLLKYADVYVKGKVFGELKNRSPQFEISFGLKDLDLNLPRNLGAFENIGFDGTFASGSAPNYSEASLEVKDLKGKLAGGFLEGEISVKNFLDPYLKYNLNAELKLDGYDEVFNMKLIKQLTGSVSLHANFDGPLKYFKQHKLDSSRSSGVTLKDLSFVVVQTNQQVSGLSGKIENKNNQAAIQGLSFTYGENDLVVNATVDNLMHYFFMRDTVLIATGTLQSKQLYTKDFLFDTLSSAYVQDRITNLFIDLESTITENDSAGMPDIEFDIKNLSATLDKLPDLKLVHGKGKFSMPDSVLKLYLHEFHATLPQGKIDISGDLSIPERRLWEFNARVNANNFPWTYIQELVAEIRTDKEPSAKKLPVKEMDLVTTELDVSASIITYPFDFTKLDIRESKIIINSADSKTMSVNKLNVALENLHFIHPINSGSITGLKSTKGTMSLMQLKVPGLNPVDIKLNVTGKNDSLDIEFSSASQISTSEKGNLFMDISKKERSYKLQYAVTGASLEFFVEKFYKKKFLKGTIDYSVNLHAIGESWSFLKQNMAGEISISGDSIQLSGVDVDKVLRKFERSQNFNLTDIGAVLIAGPVGLAVTKGSDFVSLATVNLKPNHHTLIKELHTTWTLQNQQLITKDVAFATFQNRVAFTGRIDFARDSIPGLTIAVIDKNGCSLMDQKLYGKTNNLKTGKLNITKTLFGSVINFMNVIVGKDCKPVYNGKVQAPVQ
jgi:uncharacterized protein involved in outer membrane biogenesis